MKIELKEQTFDPWQELQSYQSELDKQKGKIGACSLFVGTMRDFNAGDEVSAMFLEHYPQMTLQHLEKIAAEASQQWSLENVFIQHRFGHIDPGDTIVLIAAWSAHRDGAFQACRFIIEQLKKRAPFWKKETLSDSSRRWVQQ
ncbi:MAG: molybdenum cofactor biosynthesis protein MoaE [Gammaproteobacteria bacterium]|nr:molybdenum cofactor biosynthesis protein MoaE [Gammaproteobacteria bacterium]MDH5800289.1 molybdenum cofactor biosynthesis protein MoaE [Gammaproteobacteria bacterium]